LLTCFPADAAPNLLTNADDGEVRWSINEGGPDMSRTPLHRASNNTNV
jgi:hypothetical protein